jgi:hypothetical protein
MLRSIGNDSVHAVDAEGNITLTILDSVKIIVAPADFGRRGSNCFPYQGDLLGVSYFCRGSLALRWFWPRRARALRRPDCRWRGCESIQKLSSSHCSAPLYYGEASTPNSNRLSSFCRKDICLAGFEPEPLEAQWMVRNNRMKMTGHSRRQQKLSFTILG